MYTHVCVYIYIYIFIYLYTCIYVYIHRSLSLSMYIHKYKYIYIYIYIHTHIWLQGNGSHQRRVFRLLQTPTWRALSNLRAYVLKCYSGCPKGWEARILIFVGHFKVIHTLSALRLSKGWVRTYENLVIRIGCSQVFFLRPVIPWCVRHTALLRGNHLSNTTCVTHVFFKSLESCSNFT